MKKQQQTWETENDLRITMRGMLFGYSILSYVIIIALVFVYLMPQTRWGLLITAGLFIIYNHSIDRKINRKIKEVNKQNAT